MRTFVSTAGIASIVAASGQAAFVSVVIAVVALCVLGSFLIVLSSEGQVSRLATLIEACQTGRRRDSP